MLAYYLFRIFEIPFLALPYFLQKAFISSLAKLAYLIDTKHKKVIQTNLNLTTITEEKKLAVMRYCHKNLGKVLLQVLRSSKGSVDDLDVTFKNQEMVQTLLKDKKPIIFVSAHYGNWELGAAALSKKITPTTSIYKKMNNRYFENYLLNSRKKFNMTLVEKKGAIKHLIKAIKSGSSVAMMIDQSVQLKDGVVIEFLGVKATQTAAPAFLARKFNLPIVPLLIHAEEGKENELTFFEPIWVNQSEDEEKDILEATQKQADVFSEVILDHPEPWFWCHRRFKSTLPEIYK